MSELCSVLRERGYDARLLFLEDLPFSREKCDAVSGTYVRKGTRLFIKMLIWRILPLKRIEKRFNLAKHFPLHSKGRKIQRIPFFRKDRTIVIYPELVYGNPLGAKNVVRWLLYHYKFGNDPGAYSPSDLFIGYREIFNDRTFTPDIENFNIYSFNKDLYRKYNFGPREGKCYIVRKGASRDDLPESFDGPVIDSLPEEKKVEVFNNCEYCYSYDTQTALSGLAAICGCKSIVVPEPGKTRSDYKKAEDATYGVAWSDNAEDIDAAMNTVGLLKKRLEESGKRNADSAERLVVLLERKFGTRIRKIRKEKR